MNEGCLCFLVLRGRHRHAGRQPLVEEVRSTTGPRGWSHPVVLNSDQDLGPLVVMNAVYIWDEI